MNFFGKQSIQLGVAITILSMDCYAQSSWIFHESGTKKNLRAVIWANDSFIAVGDSGTILGSTDGMYWAPRPTDGGYNLTSTAWSGSHFIAVGGGAIVSSQDAVHWSTITSKPYLNSVIWAGNQFVSVGFGFQTGVLTSPNGVSWTSRGFGFDVYTLNSLAWSGNIIAAAGEGIILISPNGIQWERIYLHNGNYQVTPRSLGWTGSHFFAISGHDFMISTDGRTWTYKNIELLQGTGGLSSVIWTGSLFIGVGANTVVTSNDGANWTKWNIASEGGLFSVASSGDQLVAVGQTGAVFSSQLDSVVGVRGVENQTNHLLVRQIRHQIEIQIPSHIISYPLRITVHDVTGRLKRTVISRGKPVAIVPISELENGTYVLKVVGIGINRTEIFQVLH